MIANAPSQLVANSIPKPKTAPAFLKYHLRQEDGRVFPIAQVLKIVRYAKANPHAHLGQSLESNWHGNAQDVLRQWRKYCQNEINRRGDIEIKNDIPSQRLQRKLRQKVKVSCRWCGTPLPTYQPNHSRFCDDSCKTAY